MLVLETMAALTRDELVGLIREAKEDVPEPAAMYDDLGEVVQDVLTEYMAEVFIRMQRLIDRVRKGGKVRKDQTDGCRV
jgi:hypothetical protein